MNPNDDRETTMGSKYNDLLGIVEGGVVTSVDTHDPTNDNLGHEVMVKPDSFDGDMPTEIAVQGHGSTSLPEEGQRVFLAYRRSGKPLVIGYRYEEGEDVPAYEAGERRVGHPASNSYIRFLTDGSIVVNGHNGNTIELTTDGSVVINGGSTKPITNITFGTDSDDHYTSHDVTRAQDVYVPE